MTTDQIGKYRVIGKLGQGGMARVLLTMVAGPHNFNKLLVVKELRDDLAQDPEFLAMFLDEARLAAKLNHPNVVQTYEVGTEEDATHLGGSGEHPLFRFFIAMEYLEGQPLHALLRRAGRNNVSLDLQVRILVDVLAGLEYAHGLADFDGTPLHVVHRDMSPHNVFITYDGQVKIVDFGIAKAAGASSSTRAGQFKGKLGYVAPEQASGGAIDARADLFAVGVMLWEAMAGQRLTQVGQTESEAGILARRLSGADPKIREIVPDANEELANICDKAMAFEPGDRYASARAFQEALEGYLDKQKKRVGAKEIGAIVSSTFAEERVKARTLIDEQMRRQKEAVDQPVPIVDIASGSTSPLDPTPTFTAHPRSSVSGTLVASQVSQHPSSMAPAKNQAVLYGAIAFAIVAIAGGGFFALSGSPSAAKQAAQTAAAAPATATAQQAALADSISVKIAYPAGATATLDGAALKENPFVAKVPRDATMHRIDVTQGSLHDQRMVIFDKDVDLTVTPTAQTTATAVADDPPTVHRPWTRPPPVAATPATPPPTSKPTVQEDPTPHVVAPKPTIDIDETDPYHKKK